MSTGSVEGADDPGRIYSKASELDVDCQCLSLLQLKGCDSSTTGTSSVSRGLLAFTTVLGLLFIFFWICLRSNRPLNVSEPQTLDELDEVATHVPELPVPGRKSCKAHC